MSDKHSADDPIILPPRIDDAAALAALHRRCMGNADGWTDAGLARLLAADAARGFYAGEAQAPLAFILAFVAADEAEILAICVATEQRRQGLAGKLLRHLMRELSRKGIDQMYLDVRASNFAARELYGRAGFVETGRRKGYYQAAEEAVVMGRRLEP